MKTFQQWAAGNRHLDTFLKIGDEVDEEMADYFLNTLLPRTMKPDLIQLGEPYDHHRNANRQTCGTYATLKRVDGKWIYAGLCFAGESEPAKHHIFVRQTGEKSDSEMTFFTNIHTQMKYVCHQQQWHGMASDRSDGPLKAGLIIHIVDNTGKQISEEITIRES
jgi:hypothetical protein